MSDIRLPLLTEHGVTHEWVDHGDGTITVHSYQDVEAALDRNRAMANHNDGYNKARDMRRVAHIPNAVLLMWVNELTAKGATMAQALRDIRDPKFLAGKIEDPDNSYLRTAHLKMGI